jgi:6-phosphogluconolactonase
MFEDAASAASRLADLIALQLACGVAERGLATMALSGGSTPAPLYRALAERDADWPNIAATLVDERMTPPGSAGSNETFLRTTLLTGAAAAMRFTPLYSNTEPTAAADAASRALQPLVRPFDVVVLGMGVDGHTASFFPHADNLAAALSPTASPVVAVRAEKSAVTGDHLDRLTLSLREIVAARRIVLFISGEEKRAGFERAAAGEDFPVSTVLRARPDLWACWHP